MSPEAKKVNQQSCFELIDKHYSRDLSESEILGLQKLIKEYNPAEIVGKVLEIISEMENYPTGVTTIDQLIHQLHADKPRFGIHNWIREELEAEAVLLDLDS